MFLYNSDSLFLHSLALFYIFVQVVYPVAGGVFVPENYNPSFVLTYLVVGACGFCAGGMVYCWYLIFVQLGGFSNAFQCGLLINRFAM